MADQKDVSAEQQQPSPETQPPVTLPANPLPSQYVPPSSTEREGSSSAKIGLSDRIMIGATTVIAIGTLVSAGAISFQWWEMHTGGKDTTRIADAAGDQADAAQQFSDTAADINQGIADAVKKLDAQAKATQITANAAKSAAQIASNQLILGERPWLKIKHRIVGPLTFDVERNGGPAAMMTLEDTIENVGQSVAVNVLSWEELIPLDADTLHPDTALARRKHWCDANRQVSKGGMQGYVMFPHDPIISNREIGALMTKIIAQRLHNSIKRPWFQVPPDSPLEGMVGFVIVGCVSYRSSFEPRSAPAHETQFLYRLGSLDEHGLMYPWVHPRGVAKDLQLIAWPEQGTAD
jgi:hypothetical protein